MGRILPSFARAHIAFTRTGYAWNELNEGKQRDADCGTTSRHTAQAGSLKDLDKRNVFAISL